MPSNMSKRAAARPVSIEEQEQDNECLGCAKQQKIDTALAVLSLFLDSTKPAFIADPGTEDVRAYHRELGPKENSTYMSALDWLERYLDTQD